MCDNSKNEILGDTALDPIQAKLEELRELLSKSPDTAPTPVAVISQGKLSSGSGSNESFELRLGWDPATAHLCDKTWGAFNVKLMEHIEAQRYGEQELKAVLATIQIDDSHWRWLNKSLHYRSDDQYKWFFMIAEGYPQAACLVYHPKQSAVHNGQIFYIEFIAVAPWNRQNPLTPRSFVGVGKLLVDEVRKFASDKLGLYEGFSLHALPRASGFYISLGMQRLPAHDKQVLQYFEMV